MQKKDLDSIVKEEKNINFNLKTQFIYKCLFAGSAYLGLNYLFEGNYEASAIMCVGFALTGSTMHFIKKDLGKNSGSYIPFPFLTIPVGITLGCFALDELYHSLLNGPFLNP